MRLILPCVSLALLVFVTTVNALQPNHAVAELRVAPNNLTIMTPRDPGTMLERQVFDFGSPNRFLALRRIGARQGCNAGFDEEIAVGAGFVAKLGLFVTATGVAHQIKKAVITEDAAIRTQTAVQGEAAAQAVPSPSSLATTVQQGTETATPLPGTPTTRTVTTQTSSRAQTSAEVPLPPRPTSGTRSQTTLTGQATQASGSGVALAQTQSASNVGAIVGGTVAGVVALVVTLIFLILWRRKRTSAGAESEAPPDGLGPGAPYKHAYNPEVVPHTTPGTVDPFLTPMSQLPNPRISYFGGAIDRPASGASSAPHYTGLPEPQHGDDLGPAIGTSTMPVPRHDMHHPHPLPMSVTPLREPDAESGPTRVWSGFGSRPPSAQNPAQGGRNTPYETPSGQPNHETINTNSAHSNLPDAGNPYDLPPPGAPSTIYQPSSLGGGLDGNSDFYSPPASPPPEGLYPQAIPTNIGGLPIGAAPPLTNFVPTENSLY